MSSFSETQIAVVGGGPAGMTALKELRSLGFDVTLFERRDELGGIWSWTPDANATTALKETTLCNNKLSLALSDYPIPKDYPWIVPSGDLGSYFRSYAKHHDLYRNVEFNQSVTRLTRNETTQKWELSFASDEPNSPPRSFDKVVWATGGFTKPKRINISGQEHFTGRILHSQELRDFSDFKRKNVVVLGIGNTAADVANALVKHDAAQVYLSHRRGCRLIKPSDPATGAPSDILLTTALLPITWWLQKHLPSLYGKATDSALAANFTSHFGTPNPDWNLTACNSTADGLHVVVCSEDLVPNLKAGSIISTRGIKRITGPQTIELDDGHTLTDIDAIVACIGYDDDLPLLSAAIDFVPSPPTTDGPPFPSLYMNTFPPRHASSFAHLSLAHLNGPQIPPRELAAMALGQLWTGRSAFPPVAQMDAAVAAHHTWLAARVAKAPNSWRGDLDNGAWSYFMHGAAGTGLYERVGWGWGAWKLWWRDRELYRAIAGLPCCAYTFRVFETGKREVWSGAREAVLEAYRDLEALKKGKGKKVV